MIGSPMQIDGDRLHARRPPPRLGEHTAEVLAEAGYSADEVARPRDGGVRTRINSRRPRMWRNW